MRVGVELVGDLKDAMRREVDAGERAVSGAMRAAGQELKLSWRSQVVGAGLGLRLGNSVRAQSYPAQPSLNAAALVWTKAPKIIAAHEHGATIAARAGVFLAIPTPAAGKGAGGRKITPAEWEARRGVKLRLVYRTRGASLLVADVRRNARGLAQRSRSKTGRGVETVPIFVLLRQVTLRKRLDLVRDAERTLAGIPGRIVAGWKESA